MLHEPALAELELKLKGNAVLWGSPHAFYVKTVNDVIARDRSAGIPNAYVVVTTSDDQRRIIFDTGEVQTEDGTILGNVNENPFVADLVVDGHDSVGGSYTGDGKHPPFAIFCPQLQRNVGGPYAKREHAEAAVKMIREGKLLPYTNGDSEPFIFAPGIDLDKIWG